MVTTLRLPSELGYEKVAMESAAVIAARMGFAADRVDDVKTAVAEACINAIEHGNGLDVSFPVIVQLTENGSGLEINVMDAGCHKMPADLPQPTHGVLQQRGWGLFIIQNLVDEFDSGLTSQGGNYLRMRLNLMPS